jgi:hypothetical protein
VTKLPSRRQIFTVLSSLAEAMNLPSGLKVTQLTPALCPFSIFTKLPSRRQSLMVVSLLPEANSSPSGLKYRYKPNPRPK